MENHRLNGTPADLKDYELGALLSEEGLKGCAPFFGYIKWLLKRGAMIATATIAGIGIAVAIIVAILYGHPH